MARPYINFLMLLHLTLLFILLPHPSESRSTSIPIKQQQHDHQQHDQQQQQQQKEESGTGVASSSGGCEGRWIHVLDLPSRFNRDLLQACGAASFPLFSSSSFCPLLSNHGLGPRTHNRSRSWYRTDPQFMEPFFHRRIMEYPCLTHDPSLASAVFLPYYASLDALPFLFSPPLFNSSSLHGLPLYHHLLLNLPRIWNRHHSHDLFLLAARPAWDFSQHPPTGHSASGLGLGGWGTSFLEIPEFLNVTVLTVESRAWPWQEHSIPYPTSFHPATLSRLHAWISRARLSRRTNLMLFVGGGGGGGPNIRGSIRSECLNRTDLCEVVDCSGGVCAHDPIRFMRPMLRSHFCLQPPGDTPTRRSTFDGILAGCIPVFFEDLSAKSQYGWHLPRKDYDNFSLFIPKEDVVFNGVRIAEVLEAIPRAQVRRMRERLLELAPGIMYRRHQSSHGLRQRKDAFDLAIDGVLRRIKRRVRAISEPDLLYEDDEDDEI